MKQPERRPLGSSLSALAQDLVRMADLQLQLLKLDLVQFWSESCRSMVIVGTSAIAILGAIPVLLMGISGALQAWLGLSAQVSQMTVALIVIVLGAFLLRGSLLTVGEAAKSLKRSQEEFTNNLTWMREALQQDE
ncbi:MAG: phage holin family protein [Planctomycetales bacterium]